MVIQGEAGTGKSTLLRKLVEESKKRDLRVVVAAPTGLAALNVGGQTIHSLFRLRPALQLKSGKDDPYWPKTQAVFRLMANMDVLIIDEMSMVRVDLFEAIDRTLRKNLRSSKPFAGKKVVLIGDLNQLEPVVTGSEHDPGSEHCFIHENWPSRFFFDSDIYQEVGKNFVHLTENYRQQSDKEFAQALRTLTDPETANPGYFNNLCLRDAPPQAVNLTATRSGARNFNEAQMAKLGARAVTLWAKETCEGSFQWNDSNRPVPEVLTLKQGARVVICSNGEEYVNGDTGTVVSVEDDCAEIEVELDSGVTVSVEKQRWEYYALEMDAETRTWGQKVVGTFIQFPLQPAWALTIHKCQGMTLPKAHVNLGRGAFSHGQTYVALSRVRTVRDLSLNRPLRLEDVIVDLRVSEYLRNPW